MSGIKTDPVATLSDVIPGLRAGSGAVGAKLGVEHHLTFPLGPPLLVDGVTYKQILWIAPCNGCFIKQGYVSAAVAMAGGTDTLAFDNYDASANTARNVLSATNIDPSSGITAKEGLALTLSTTLANRQMDAGDCLNATLVCGTMTTDGEGYAACFTIIVPEV
jgi:hypothetical protein